jgi:hypothetical protein
LGGERGDRSPLFCAYRAAIGNCGCEHRFVNARLLTRALSWLAEVRRRLMLRAEDLEMQRGRASHGGDFLRLVHVPTGIARMHAGPLGSIDQHTLISSWVAEIEIELRSQGLTQYVTPDSDPE